MTAPATQFCPRDEHGFCRIALVGGKCPPCPVDPDDARDRLLAAVERKLRAEGRRWRPA